MPTDHLLSSQAIERLNAISLQQLDVIRAGMRHSIEEHGQDTLALGLGMCEDSVLVVCGAAAYKKLMALHEQHQEVRAADQALSVLSKAAGK